MILTCYDLVNYMCIHCNDADNTSSVSISNLCIVHNILYIHWETSKHTMYTVDIATMDDVRLRQMHGV